MAPGGACRGAGPADGTGRVRGRRRPTRVGGLARARDPRPLPVNASDAVPRFPRGWSAGGVARGTGYANPNGSRRVREVQRRLLRRGYRAGPVDGRFGPRTRAAVMWFQMKHGLARTGRIDARSLATLRENREMVRIRETAPAPLPATAAGFLPVTVEPADQGWLMLLAWGCCWASR